MGIGAGFRMMVVQLKLVGRRGTRTVAGRTYPIALAAALPVGHLGPTQPISGLLVYTVTP